MGKNRRRNKVVDPKLQGNLLLRAISHWGFLVVWAFVILFFWQVFIGHPHAPLSAHVKAVWFRYGPFFIVMLCLQPVVVYDSVKYTHRLAGPLLRLRQALQNLVDRKPVQPIRLRKGDFCQDLAENFNLLLAQIQPNGHPSANDEADCDPSLASVGKESGHGFSN